MQDDDIFVDREAEENRAAQEREEDDDVENEESGVPNSAKLAKLKKELAACRKEKQENMDGWQRAKADYVNALHRFEEEKKAAKNAGVASALDALLPAYDAIERAKEHGEIPEGFAAIVRQLESAFASLGLEPVGVVGEPFNPEIHEAMGQDDVQDAAQDETVTVVFEKGWKQGEKVLRAAKVRVGKLA